MEKGLHTRITIVLADRKECAIIELKDDTKDISYSSRFVYITPIVSRQFPLMYLSLKLFGNKQSYTKS